MSNNSKSKKFVRHFRIYFKNNHPAYIVDEEGTLYVFHRVTHSKTSGGKTNWIINNPFKGYYGKTYIVKQEQKDEKGRFSKFEIELKPNIDVSYPEIKKAGSLQTLGRTRYESGIHIKTNRTEKSNKKAGRSQNEQKGSNVNNNFKGNNIKTTIKKKTDKTKIKKAV